MNLYQWDCTGSGSDELHPAGAAGRCIQHPPGLACDLSSDTPKPIGCAAPNMPSGEYSGAAGGALKLKGGKIQKSKKKKSKSKDKDVSSKLERSSRSTSAVAESKDDNGNVADKAVIPATTTSDHEEDDTTEYKTEAERRHEEAMKKRVSETRPSISRRPSPLIAIPLVCENKNEK
jgi:protein FAM32A